jgi:hypothetical protein
MLSGRKKPMVKAIFTRDLEEDLQAILDIKLRISRRGAQGKIEPHFSSLEALGRILKFFSLPKGG